MLFSDYGLLNYGTALLTQPKRLAEEPELCAAFVDGALQGLKATMLDPVEAMKRNILANRGGRPDAELDALFVNLTAEQKAQAHALADAFKPLGDK